MKGKKIFKMEDGKPIQIDKIPEGSVRVHLHNYRNVLRPRGTMEKESLGLSIYEALMSAFEHWTDRVYGDNPERAELIKQLKANMHEEVQAAWSHFVADILKKGGK